MAGERLAELAVKSVVDWIDAQLPTYLRAVEAQLSLASGALTDPSDVVAADVPDYGGATPLIEVWETVGAEESRQNRIYQYGINIAVTHAYDADIETGRRFVRNYMTALVDCIHAGPTLGGKVDQIFIGSQSFAVEHGSNAKHLHHAVLETAVRIFDTAGV